MPVTCVTVGVIFVVKLPVPLTESHDLRFLGVYDMVILHRSLSLWVTPWSALGGAYTPMTQTVCGVVPVVYDV